MLTYTPTDFSSLQVFRRWKFTTWAWIIWSSCVPWMPALSLISSSAFKKKNPDALLIDWCQDPRLKDRGSRRYQLQYWEEPKRIRRHVCCAGSGTGSPVVSLKSSTSHRPSRGGERPSHPERDFPHSNHMRGNGRRRGTDDENTMGTGARLTPHTDSWGMYVHSKTLSQMD